jgi:chromate reductase, NAD(P)H dehydrogenase (quinone)
MHVLAISGSLQAGSHNTALLRTARARAPAGVVVELFEGLASLPHFNPDLEREGTVASVDALRAAVARADALLVACPEYGFSLPGVLKNAVDWLIGSGELERKRVAITAATVHAERGLMGLAALRTTLGAVSAEVVFDAPIVRKESIEPQLDALLAALCSERPIAQAP